jgi:gamma-glutamyltranspeptidase / glutathione hydrolase
MRGAIAAGHPLTAEAGASVLEDGGNAVDACIAAAFASWVVESPLTGPGGGGFMAVHRGRDRSTRVLDFFVNVPGLGGEGQGSLDPAAMEAVDVDFTPESSQQFRIGRASCAVPGVVAGLAATHAAYATRPWSDLVAPAVELARDGVEITRSQAYLHAILDVVLRHTEEGRAIYGKDGERLAFGDRLQIPDLAGTMEALAEGGADAFYRGDIAAAIVESVDGRITPRDLAEYRVIRRRPVRAGFIGHELDSNPPPSTGGVLIAYGLRLLDELGGVGGAPGSAAALERVVGIMREQARAREGRFTRELHRGGLARRLLDPAAIREAAVRVRSGVPPAFEPAPARGTTHISVVDAEDNAASLTATTGSGSGVIVPGTGIHLNNMLGEFDLSAVAALSTPGRRMTSMMAPTIVLRGGRARLVVGSAGSLRLRGAIMQIVINAVGHRLPIEEAIDHPRVHVEGSEVHCEGGLDPEQLDALEERGYDLVRWRRRNLYFGGAAAVEVYDDDSLAAAGDPRRGGTGIVVS